MRRLRKKKSFGVNRAKQLNCYCLTKRKKMLPDGYLNDKLLKNRYLNNYFQQILSVFVNFNLENV